MSSCHATDKISGRAQHHFLTLGGGIRHKGPCLGQPRLGGRGKIKANGPGGRSAPGWPPLVGEAARGTVRSCSCMITRDRLMFPPRRASTPVQSQPPALPRPFAPLPPPPPSKNRPTQVLALPLSRPYTYRNWPRFDAAGDAVCGPTAGLLHRPLFPGAGPPCDPQVSCVSAVSRLLLPPIRLDNLEGGLGRGCATRRSGGGVWRSRWWTHLPRVM